MKFAEFAQVLEILCSTAGRNEMTRILAEFLPKLSREEIAPTMYLLAGRLVPKYIALEFNASRKLLLRALVSYVHCASREVLHGADVDPQAEVQALFGKLGDEGLVVAELLKDNKPAKALTIKEVYGELKRLAEASGAGSQELKIKTLGELFLALDPLSAKFVARIIIGNLRLGLSDKTVLDTLSWLKTGTKSLRALLDRAYGAHADIGSLTELVLETPTVKLTRVLENIKLEAGVAIAAKLVEREKSAAALFKRLGHCVLQPKLDGLRAQIHLTNKGEAFIFSRNMESLTEMFPDILRAVKSLGVKSAIIDSEAIGYDFENELFLPFNETMQRRRKYDVGEMAESIPVRAMAFDLLYLDGRDLSRQPLEERLAKLREIIEASDQKVITFLETIWPESEEEVEAYFQEQISEGLEGIIAKKLGTPYEPGTRNFDWIKLKANTQSEMVDTVDVVVLGYFYGRGERAKYGFGSLLTGVYNPKDGKYYSVAKVGSGFTDAEAPQILADMQTVRASAKPDSVVVEKLLYPDVWLTPDIVMEVTADEITRSPAHTAVRDKKASFEKDHKGRGLSLRFPRLKRWNRDKDAEQATSTDELLRMYELRKG